MKIRQFPLFLVILVFTFLLFEFSDIDILVQNLFYDFQFKLWLLDRNNSVLKFIFYDGVKALYILFVLSLLITLIFFRKKSIVQKYKQGLIIVFASCVLVPLTIGGLKAVTNVPCPKDIQHFGGKYPHVTVLSSYPENFTQTKNIKCYPAGHASGGFALMSLFFLFPYAKWKKTALIFAICLGWSTGTYKMLIGDHFLSHTVVTMLLAWLIILAVEYVITHAVFSRAGKRD